MVEDAVARRKKEFELAFPNAAGIDIGSASHFVAVPPDRAEAAVREFKSFTEDLEALADWLQACEVDTVAMESTGAGSTGLRSTSCWKRAASTSTWSMPGM